MKRSYKIIQNFVRYYRKFSKFDLSLSSDRAARRNHNWANIR